MRIVMFCHSLLSDWNHGNAHFLRGIASELVARGHRVTIYEPRNGWSLCNLMRDHGGRVIERFKRRYPQLHIRFYNPPDLDVDRVLKHANLVIVHEWTAPGVIEAISRRHRRSARSLLLFHDTHHRSLTDQEGIGKLRLHGFDGILAFGNAVRDIYISRGWHSSVWTWHEAADTRIFHPKTCRHEGDLIWIGNWGDEERTEELKEFLIKPVRDLNLRTKVYGVRYPQVAIDLLKRSGIEYGGYLPNFDAPREFARYAATIHVPRRPYVKALPGIPTIRPFEALACGIPLICSPWNDVEGMFTAGRDYLQANDANEMKTQLKAILGSKGLARRLSRHGCNTILARHTCGHRVDQLFQICRQLGLSLPANMGAR